MSGSEWQARMHQPEYGPYNYLCRGLADHGLTGWKNQPRRDPLNPFNYTGSQIHESNSGSQVSRLNHDYFCNSKGMFDLGHVTHKLIGIVE